jgi:hypothetical protein
MGPRPWKPKVELAGALEQGNLDTAIILAKEVVEDHGQVELRTALGFLPLVADQRPDEYDRWAAKWLVRWLSEARSPTIDGAAEVAATLADLPADPSVVERLASA